MIKQMFGVATQTSGKTVGSHIGPIFQFWRKQGTIQVKNQHSLLFVFHVTASEAVSLLDFV
jgi:hypothetical protein